MSKRGKILTQYKEGHALIIDALRKAKGLDDEDTKWLATRIFKYEEGVVRDSQDLRQTASNLDKPARKNTQKQYTDDDLPF